jgi:hypothetical protein
VILIGFLEFRTHCFLMLIHRRYVVAVRRKQCRADEFMMLRGRAVLAPSLNLVKSACCARCCVGVGATSNEKARSRALAETTHDVSS